MRVARAGVMVFLFATAPLSDLRAQGGDPNGWHDGDGSYLSFWQDFFVEDGGIVTAVGVSEEDYDNFGHFVHVTTTLHGGASNRVVTGSATNKFFACAEAGFSFQPGSDEGTYYLDVQYSWTCPYLGNGFTEFVPSVPVPLDISLGIYYRQNGLYYNYVVCLEYASKVNCDEMEIFEWQLPNPPTYPGFLWILTLDYRFPPGVGVPICYTFDTEVAPSCTP